jgi:cell division septation protein DedD
MSKPVRRSLWTTLSVLAVPVMLWLAGPSRPVESSEGGPKVGLRAKTGGEDSGYVITVIGRSLGRPQGIALDPGGSLIVTQSGPESAASGYGAVVAIDLLTRELRLIYLDRPSPTQVSAGPDGAVYWTSRDAGAILRLAAGQSRPETLAGGLTNPSGIAVDAKARVYFTEITEPGGRRPIGALSELDGGRPTVLSPAESEPVSVAAGPGGELYWTASTGGSIFRRTSDGRTDVLLSGLDRPVGIAVDPGGTKLAFTEVPTPGVAGESGGRNTVSVLDLKSLERTLVQVGDPEPLGVALADDGTVYWSSASAGELLQARPRTSASESCRGGEDDARSDDEPGKSSRDDEERRFRARTRLTGANAVPPVDTKASGKGCFLLVEGSTESVRSGRDAFAIATVDAESGDPRLDFALNVKKITGVMQAHLHLGPAGVNGPIVAYLFDAPTPTGTVNGLLARGTIRLADLVGPLAGNWSGFVNAFLAGGLYVNVHTVAHPEGEIRGQIVPAGGGNHPPRGVILSPPDDVTVSTGQPVFFAGTASDPDGDMVTVAWDFGDGTSSTALVPGDHSYAEPGAYNVTFTATDSHGLTDPDPPHRVITVTGGPSATPTPGMTPTQTPTAPPSATFTPTQTPTAPPSATSTPTPPAPTSTPTRTPTTPPPTPTPTTPPPTPTPPPSAPTLTQIQNTVFTPLCTGCHGGPSPTCGMNLTAGQAYSNLVNQTAACIGGIRVIPFNPDQSALVIQLASGHRNVPANLQNDIRNWISAGALNN